MKLIMCNLCQQLFNVDIKNAGYFIKCRCNNVEIRVQAKLQIDIRMNASGSVSFLEVLFHELKTIHGPNDYVLKDEDFRYGHANYN